jgi:hypothetical protein
MGTERSRRPPVCAEYILELGQLHGKSLLQVRYAFAGLIYFDVLTEMNLDGPSSLVSLSAHSFSSLSLRA